MYIIVLQCRIGSEVTIKVSGDFYYNPVVSDPPHDLLLVAGGVGINPLASMLHHASDLHKILTRDNEDYLPCNILMLYSAKTYEELLYKVSVDCPLYGK